MNYKKSVINYKKERHRLYKEYHTNLSQMVILNVHGYAERGKKKIEKERERRVVFEITVFC